MNTSRPILRPQNSRPISQWAEGQNMGKKKHLISMNDYSVLRENFLISTWLLMGACAQGVLLLLITLSPHIPFISISINPIWSLAPAFIVLGYRLTDTLLMTFGIKRNHYMDGVIRGKWAVEFPDEQGVYTGKPAGSEVCVIILAGKCNHPLGLWAPHYQGIGEYFKRNVRSLEASPEEFGWLGMNGWIQAGDKSAGSEVMMVGYFKNVDYLHRFAHSTSHRKGWTWWNNLVTKGKVDHLGIMHEVYMVPKDNWEAIYANYAPTGLGTPTTEKHTISDPMQTTKWFRPIIDASQGVYRSSAGRMNRQPGGAGNTKYENADPYGDAEVCGA